MKQAQEELEKFNRNAQIQESGKNSEDSDYSGDENEIVGKEGRDSREKEPKNRSVEGKERENTTEKNGPKKPKIPPGLKKPSKK